MKYILGIVGFIILAIVAIVMIASTGNNGSNQLEGERKVALTDYIATDATVIYTREGKLVGNDEHRAIRITVNRTERRVEVLKGYNYTVESSQAFPNNQAAFDSFMRALTNAGFSLERETQQKDSRGTCPLGNRYIFDLNNGSESLQHLWSTSCSNSEGTFGGNDRLVGQLFQNQIPGI